MKREQLWTVAMIGISVLLCGLTVYVWWDDRRASQGRPQVVKSDDDPAAEA